MALIIILHAFLILIGLAAFLWAFISVFNRIRLYSKFSEMLSEKYNYEPKVSIIIPIRGVDEKLKENTHALYDMDYPRNKYEILFVVDEDDEIYNALKKITRKNKNVRILHSEVLPTCSGKNSAMITGVKHAKYDVIACIDSDAKPSRIWLKSIVGPLSDKTIGVTTGYRFYVPSASFTSYLLSAWNNIGLRQMRGSYAFVWGGSFAIRKETIKKLNIIKKWSRAISEDAIITEAIRKTGMRIKFMPQCITHSRMSYRFSHPLEFTTRQLTLVKLYDRKIWNIALLLYLFERIMVILGIILLYLFLTTSNPLFALESFLMLWPIVFGLLKASIEHRNLEKLIKGKTGSRLKYIIADFFAQWLMTYNLLRSWKKNTLRWRGRTYRIKLPYEIEVIE